MSAVVPERGQEGSPARGVPDVQSRILSAACDLIARRGIASTTVEEVAREAGVSRATVYRHFPGGRDELLAAVSASEALGFLDRLAAALAPAEDLESFLTGAILFSRQAVDGHEMLQAVLAKEPELVAKGLSVGAGLLLSKIGEFMLAHLSGRAIREDVDVKEAADYLARMTLSVVASPAGWDLAEPATVRELVRSQLLGGLTGS
jgi:AcrR family transcriptional regulator